MIERKDVPTTDRIQPRGPEYPKVRRPAEGLMISTENIEKIHEAQTEAGDPAPAKRGRPRAAKD